MSTRRPRLEILIEHHIRRLTRAIRKAAREQLRAELRARDKEPDGSCIAPACPNPSKGARFHGLCALHQHAPRRTYQLWRKWKERRRRITSPAV